MPAPGLISSGRMARETRRAESTVTGSVLALAPWLDETGRAPLLAELIEAAGGEKATAAERAQLRLWRAVARAALGDAQAAGEDAQAALAQARRCKAKAIEARALSIIGFADREAGKPRDAVRKLERALDMARKARDRELEAETANRLALVRWDLGDCDAGELFEQALTLARRGRMRRLEGRVLGNLATVALATGDEASFVRHNTAAIAIFRGLGNRRHEGYGCCNLAAFLGGRGDLGQARELYLQSLAAAEEAGDRRLQALVIGQLGLLEQRQDGPGAGGSHLERAVALLAGAEAWQFEAFLTAALSVERAAHGRTEEAAALLDRAEALLADRAGERVLDLFRVHRGHLELAQARRADAIGDPAAARQYRHEASARLERAERMRIDGDGEHAAGLVLDPADLAFAVRLLRQAFEQAEPAAAIAALAPGEPPPPHALVVDADGAWFQPPGGELVDLSRRRPLMRLVAALADHRWRAAPAPLTLADLVAAGWPGERILPAAAQDRLHVAISTLRKLGLRNLLLHAQGGYFFDRGVPVIVGARVTSVVGRS